MVVLDCLSGVGADKIRLVYDHLFLCLLRTDTCGFETRLFGCRLFQCCFTWSPSTFPPRRGTCAISPPPQKPPHVRSFDRARSTLLSSAGALRQKHTIEPLPANVLTPRFPPSHTRQVALCALAQLFIVVTHPPLVRLLVLETLGSGDGGGARGSGSGSGSAAEPGAGSSAPLLALLQGDREELCLGALVVLQVRRFSCAVR